MFMVLNVLFLCSVITFLLRNSTNDIHIFNETHMNFIQKTEPEKNMFFKKQKKKHY